MLRARRAAPYRLTSLTPPFLLAAASAAFTVWQDLHVAVLVDIAYVTNTATRIAGGDVPYKDFPLVLSPGTFLIQALFIKVFGPSYPVLMAYAAVAGGIATALTYMIVRHVLADVRHAPRALAAVLTVPLVPLGIYGIYPHPFYDPDSCLAALAATAAIFAARTRPTRMRWSVAGILLSLPVFIEQNIGGVFLVVTVVALAAEAVWRPAARLALRWCVEALCAALAVELLTIQFVAGLDNYLRWALGFAVSGRGIVASRLSAFTDPRIVWPGVLIVILVLAARRLPTSARGAAFLAALIVPAIATAVVPGIVLAAPQLFPPLLIAATVLALIHAAVDGADFDTLLPAVLIATAAGAFLSQGVGGSSYGIFPLLVLGIASIVRHVAHFIDQPASAAPLTGVALAVMLAVSGLGYVLSERRLQFVDVDAPGEVVRSAFPSLVGLSARGPYISDLDAILVWVRENVPRDEPMVFLPGEDPAFFALGRPPRLPSVYFYDVANPYSATELALYADQIGLRWVVVKDRLQLREAPPMEDELVAELTDRAQLIANVGPYRVYRR